MSRKKQGQRTKPGQSYIIHMAEPVPQTADFTAQLVVNTHRLRAIEYVEALKHIYLQPPARREPGWQAKILQLNQMVLLAHAGWGVDEWALTSYVLTKGSMSQEEILFLNFLFQHGANKTPFVIASSVFISISYKYQNHHYLRWLLEDCECLIYGDTHRGHPLQCVEQQPDSLWSTCFLEKLPHCNANNDTALIVAVRFNLPKLVKWLIEEKGHDINAQNSDGETALFIAVRYKHENSIAYLLNHNADIYTRTVNDQTVFHRAILDNNIELLIRLNRLIQQHHRRLDEICTTEGYNLAQWAIMQGAYFMLPYLLADISPHLHDPVGRNLAITSACFSGSHEFTASLLRAHPDLNIHEVTQEGMSVLHHCIVETGGGIATLNWLLNDLHVDLEAKTTSGETPLLFAAKLNKTSIVRHLCGLSKENAVNTKAISSNGRHIGHYLAQFDQHELINLLLKANKLDIAHRDDEGNTMFDVALTSPLSHHASIRVCMMYLEKTSKKRENVVLPLKHLKKLPALLNFLSKNDVGEFGPWVEDGQTALHIACLYLSREEIMRLITECKLNVNTLNQKMQTPFYTVIKHRSFDDVVWFHEHFQPKTAKLDGLNSSLLQVACEQENLDLVRWCFEKPGFSLSMLKARKDGCNALDIALIKENLDIVRYLLDRLTAVERSSYIASLLKDESPSIAYLTRQGLYVPPSLASAELVKKDDLIGDSLSLSVFHLDSMTLQDTIETHGAAEGVEMLSKSPAPSPSRRRDRTGSRRQALRRQELNGQQILDTISVDALSAESAPAALAEEEDRELPARLTLNADSTLSAATAPWTGYPRCYLENPYLKHLLEEISLLFQRSICEGYLYGSAHYKVNPGDFDILITNIKTPEDVKNAQTLIYSFIAQGGVVTTNNPVTGEWGYRKFNRYVIPVEWKNFKLEFIISSKDCSEHAQLLDFTIGARYFNLKKQQMHSISGVNAFVDTYRKEINTIIDPLQSFSEDLSRVFRAVRLVAEGFVLSPAVAQAIKTIFSRPENPLIAHMDPNKLTQQLTLLFASTFKLENFIILSELGVLARLVECLSIRNDKAGKYYYEQIKPYHASYIEEFSVSTDASVRQGKSESRAHAVERHNYSSSQCFFSQNKKTEKAKSKEKGEKMLTPHVVPSEARDLLCAASSST